MDRRKAITSITLAGAAVASQPLMAVTRTVEPPDLSSRSSAVADFIRRAEARAPADAKIMSILRHYDMLQQASLCTMLYRTDKKHLGFAGVHISTWIEHDNPWLDVSYFDSERI